MLKIAIILGYFLFIHAFLLIAFQIQFATGRVATEIFHVVVSSLYGAQLQSIKKFAWTFVTCEDSAECPCWGTHPSIDLKGWGYRGELLDLITQTIGQVHGSQK